MIKFIDKSFGKLSRVVNSSDHQAVCRRNSTGIRGSNVAYYINVRAFDVLPGLPFKGTASWMWPETWR